MIQSVSKGEIAGSIFNSKSSRANIAPFEDDSSRKQVLAVVRMVEIAQLLGGAALERECTVA
ncbi:hypothetical protein PspCFBP13509_27240 [Pseudomonas sp. CFBP13509]|nr:hypothetical protein PspCFBP13509_27240 [Pseudomonas sp. CFBP13509]